ncbi:Phospholipid scramblase 3 [Myotis davidii]|uniref:Phospholipid scramblase n=1 Tax=Myotis davidii TaxID=225400 RepID=L5LTQ1_MYODS|nr:Phospholipid scramblase 3 [Myotis davidii]
MEDVPVPTTASRLIVPFKPSDSDLGEGLLQEALTDADDFGLQFLLDLDVRVKAVLLGATFLIDYMFFNKRGGSGPSAITS